jgi:5-methyltetrahydropteroyltriglutamate--homocysteine methyltransferase
MPKDSPPFRADHVGSLLRPTEIRQARARKAERGFSAAELAAVEDAAIKRAIARQQEIGLAAVTDGEFRRAAWHWDFLGGFQGVETATASAGVSFKSATTAPTLIRIVGKPAFGPHPMLDHFAFVKRNTSAVAKMCIPSPTHFVGVARDWRSVADRQLYPELDALVLDLALAYRDAIRAFADTGCRYLQIDDCNFAFLCDPAVRQSLAQRGDDPQAMVRAFAELVADSLAERPPGMTITMHSCRGNFRSTWLAEGSWEAVAEVMFNTVPVDAFFLEYDSERAGGFEPLRFMPKSCNVVLGLISSKLPALESKDAIKRRIDEATRYVDLERLHLSPQCGFASTQEGNVMSEDEQWRKLAHVVEIAGEVWSR